MIYSPSKDLKKHLFVIFAIVFLEFLIMGIAVGTLPMYIHHRLGFSNFIVGLVIGIQYVATLLTRKFAGRLADSAGGKRSAYQGLAWSALSGIFCLAALLLSNFPIISLIILLLGRVVLGIGESFLIIGIFTTGFILAGRDHTGRVMVWNGMGMYGGIACGAPLGIFLESNWSLWLAFGVICILPGLSILVLRQLPLLKLPERPQRLQFKRAMRLVWRPGMGLAFASIGFGYIASFITLYFTERSWENSAFAVTAFGAGYIIMRLFFAGLPDRWGGAKVALLSLLIEVIGQLMIAFAGNGTIAITGAGLTGLGMSLVFPSFGLIAVNKADTENRGMAVAAYNAFFDIGVAVAAPLAGLIAGREHYNLVYLAGALAALISAGLAFSEYRHTR
jgi:MFS family permease